MSDSDQVESPEDLFVREREAHSDVPIFVHAYKALVLTIEMTTGPYSARPAASRACRVADSCAPFFFLVATTIMGLRDHLQATVDRLKERADSVTLQSSCELFLTFVSKTDLHDDFETTRQGTPVANKQRNVQGGRGNNQSHCSFDRFSAVFSLDQAREAAH